MNEEFVSARLFDAGSRDEGVQMLSWQSVDGKGYFTADVKLRMPDGRRMEPDLIVLVDRQVWLIEVKGRHSEALDDEAKLRELLALGREEILGQIRVRTGAEVEADEVVAAVAFFEDDLDPSPEGEAPAEDRCVDGIVHVDWGLVEAEVLATGLRASLRALYLAQQSST